MIASTAGSSRPRRSAARRLPRRRWRRTSSSSRSLVYRTGAYAPNGMPFANGIADYYKLVNERDGGINGVKIIFEECETGYATDRGVECYERLKGKGPTGAALLQPAVDRHHLRADREGAGRQDPAASPWATAAPNRATARCSRGTSRCSAPTGPRPTSLIQHIAKKEGGFDKLKGKKIALVYHDSPTARSRSRCCRSAPRCTASSFKLLPVTHPGVEQKAHLAADPPEPARLRAAVGLGRDELDRDQGGGGRRLSARQDVRRVVVGRRARRDARPATAPRATTR